MDEIIIGVQMGNVTLSFKTDQDASNLDEGLETIRKIVNSHKALFKSLSEETFWKTSGKSQIPSQNLSRTGKAETSLILRKIGDNLLPKTYFKSAKTTGDVKSELKTQTGIDFTSRKVSQALGLLFKKRVLSRVGSKGNFRYIQQ
jgi:hypothetical protein